MADTPFSYTGVQPGQAPMPDIMQDDLLLPQEIPEAYTPDPFDPFGKLDQAVVNKTPYEELLKRAKRRNPDALDVDFDGRQTEALGKEKGLPFDRDTVLGVEVYGEHISSEKLAQMDGGKELLALTAQKRTGRRGFFEAIATGSGADFLPFVGDLASWGVSIRNMSKVRDTFRKLEAGQEVTLQEKVLAKLYEEDSLRGSTATWLGTAGSIIRTAPAFAAEFALTGGAFSAGKAGLTKVGLLAAKEAGEDMAVRTATMALKKATQEAARSGGAITAERLGVDAVLKNLVADSPGMAVHMPAMKAAAQTYVELAQNPRRIKAFTDGLIDYAKRGILDHGTDVVRDLPPGIQGKLIEAAGVAFVEAPIKGAMYAAFDQGVVNPIVAGVMGADEAVTKTELSITMAGAYGHDKELMDNAKMLAFGTAVAEYASESSGRAFGAVFGAVTDVAGAAGRGLARRGIRAAAPEVAEGVTPYKQGSIARQLMDAMLGTEDQMNVQMRGIKRTAVEETLAAARSTDEAMRAGAEKLLGKEVMEQLPSMTADRLLAGQKDVVERIVTDKMRFMDNSLIGYWVANKMLEKNFTPQKMTKWLETLGYDGIMGEYMEERYNGFAQGFFNLDGTPDKGFWDRIVKGTKQGFMPGWEQTAAEIFAFALPTVSRMAVAKSFQVIGAGPIGAMDTLAKSIGDAATRGVGVVIQGEDGLQKYVPGITTDADSEGVLPQFRKTAGRVDLDATKAQFQKTLDDMEEETVRGIPALAKYVDKGETGFTGFLARSATALAAVLTGGNPIVGGFMASNPIKAAMIDRLGSREAALLANSLLAAYKTASVRAQAEQAKASATAAEPQSGTDVATPAEATFSTAEKRAEAEFRIMSRSILRNYLQQHGTVMVDNKAKDSYVKNLFKTEAVEGKFAGLTETEFKKQFDEEILARAAQGDIKFDVIGGKARAVLVKKATGELSEMYKQAENFLGQIGVDSYLDLDGVEGSLSDRMKLFAGTPVDADLLRMAATDNGAEGDKAAQQMMMSGLVSSAHGLERGIDAAKEYARALLTANEGFFRPQYEDAKGTRFEVRKTEGGGYRIYNTAGREARENTQEFNTAGEAEVQLTALGMQKRKASIYHTPTGTLITKYASMLLHPSMSSSEYLKSFKDRGSYADKNPVFKDGISTEQAQAELKTIMAMAERYANERHTIAEADMEAHREAFEQALGADGFETKAREYAETSGIRMVRSPVTRGELTYVVASAALNFGGEMYIPYKYAGSPTGIIEDSIENAVKGKTEWVRVGDKFLEYGIFRDPANPDKWRPSILPLVNRIYSELTSLERRFENSTDPAEKRAAKEAKLMSGWFGQEYNSEGMSHMVSAFAFYRGLAAMGVGGTAQGGSAFYATLGRITEAVVTDHSYDALLSLVHRVNNRHVGGELSDKYNLYAETLSGFIPPALMDYPIRNSLGVKTTVGRNAREASARLANSINRAVEGRPPFTGVAEFANDEDSPEGRKARDLILAEMSRILARASMKGGDTRMGTSDSVLSYFPEDLIEIAEQAKANIIEAQRLEAAGVKVEATPEVQANVQAAAANSSEPADSDAKQEEPESYTEGDEIRDDFGASFAEDAVNTSPAFAYDYAKRIAAANKQFIPDGDDPMKLTADGAFDVWKKIDPLLEEKSRESFKAKMEKHVEKKKPQPAPVAFGEIFTEGIPPWMDVLAEDLTDDPETSGVSYSPDAIARALEKDMHARLFSGLSLRWFPQFRGDSSKVKTELVLASRNVEGDSVGSLFDEAVWEADGGIHRAFENAETFEKFLSAANADAKSTWQPELKAFLRTLGYKSSFRLALRLKGAWMRDVISIKAGDGVISIDTAKASLSAGADRRLRAGLYSKLSQMKDPAVYRDKLSVLALGDTLVQGLEEMPKKDRVVELAKRLINRSTQLADVVDAVAGSGTDLAGALRDPMASWMRAREVVNNWKTETVNSLVQTYGRYEFGKKERGGLLAMRVSATAESYAEAYKKARGDAKLQKDEAFLREASGRAAAMLMRGSTIEAEAFAKADQPSRAGDRGVISSFLNDYASRFGQPVVSRTGLSRNGDYGATKVRALNPEMAAGQKAANFSEKRLAVLLRSGIDPKSSDPAVAAYAQRLLMLSMWPGYSMFASVSSLRRPDGSEVSEPTHDELERYLRESFDKGDAVARAAITTTDKTEGSFVVQWPRMALKELTGVDNPTYDQFYTAAAELVRADRVSTKRSAVFLSQGWGITKQNPRIGIDLTENLVGDSMIAGVYAKAAQLDGARENNKAHFTAVLPDGSVVFIKAKQRVQPTSGKAVLKDAAQAMSDAMTEHKLDLYLDLDALKESEILAKDASGRTAVALFAAGVMDAEVTLPQGGTAKVSDIATKYGLELQARKVGDKSVPMVIATIPGGLQMQYAANLTKSSKPSDIDLYTDFVRELVSPVTQSLQAQLAAAYLNRPGVKAATEAKAIESLRNADPWVSQLLDAGASVNDPDIYPDYRLKLSAAMKAEFNAFRALGSKYAESSNGRTVVKDADKDPMFTADGRFFQVSDSYGAPGLVETGDTGHSPSALTHNAIALTAEEAKRKGRTHLPSTVQVNNAAPGFRYAMRVRDGVGPMELRDRLSAVYSAMKQSIAANDASVYLKAYADAENGLDGVFVNPDGSAAPAGALYNIGDLFDADGRLDLSAIYDGKDVKTDAKGEAYTLVRGELLAGSRTPLDNQSSWRLLSAAEPVSTVKADGSHTYRYRKVVQTADGFDAVMVPYPEGTLVPGPDAHIRMNEGDALLSGGDHDGDAGGLAQLRHDKYGRLITEVEGAVKAVAEGADDAEAAKLFKVASEAVANAAVLEAIGKMANRSVAKDLARTGGARGHALFESDPIRSLTTTVERRAKSGVIESALIEGGRIEHGALVKPNLADAKSAAKFTTAASDNANLGRSKAVDTAAQVLIAHNNGIRLKAFGESQQFLTPPATLSAEGRVRFAQMFGASATKDASRGSAAWAEFRNFAARAKNVTFDDLKEGIMTWAEIYPAVIDLYVWMGYNSGASTRAQFDEFHMLWAEWMRSPEGRNILKAYANKLDPDAAGGPAFRAELDARVSILKGYDRGEQREKILMGLNPQSRDALASVMMARGLTGTEAIENLKPLASLFRGMTAMSNVKRVYDWKKLDAAYADKYESAARAVESVEALLLGKSGALTVIGEGRELEAAVLSAKAWVRTFAPVHEAGLYADKVRDAVVTAKFNRIEIRPVEMGGGVEVAVPEAADYDAAENASKTHLAWKAAVEITPAETQAKIRQLVGADTATGAPVRFVTAVEKVWQEMFRIWARQMKNEGGKANGAFEHLLPPSSENKLNRIALMGSIDASDAIAVVGSGLEALRNWKSEETWVRAVKQNVFEKGAAVTVEITPADAYWMLLQYATLTSGKGLDAGRAKQSLVPLFGTQVFAALGAGQVRMTQNISRKDAFEAVTVAVYPKGSNRASKLTTAGGYDALRFAMKEIERRARLGVQAEASPLAEPVVMKAEAVEQPKFDNIAPVAEVKTPRDVRDALESLELLPDLLNKTIVKSEYDGLKKILTAEAIGKDPSVLLIDKEIGIDAGDDFSVAPEVLSAYKDVRKDVAKLMKEALEKSYDGALGEMLLKAARARSASVEIDGTLLERATSMRYRLPEAADEVLAFIEKFSDARIIADTIVDPVSGISKDDDWFVAKGEAEAYKALPVSIRRLAGETKEEGFLGRRLAELLVDTMAALPVSGYEKAREELLRGQMELPFGTQKQGVMLSFVQSPVNDGPGTGPGTELGTGADVAMRAWVKAADAKAFVGVTKTADLKKSSTATSAVDIASVSDANVTPLGSNTWSVQSLGSLFAGPNKKYGPGEARAMIAGNSGTRLTAEAKAQIKKLADAGFEFAVGSMPNHTDTDAIEYLLELGAKVTVFSWKPMSDTSRLNDRLRSLLMGTPFVARDAAGEALQTEASSALAHMKSMLMSSRAANAEDFRIPAMINGGVAATKPTDVEAASKAALAFERFANLPWMAKLSMAKAVSKAAAEATRELGFVDPSVPLALTLAVGRDAILNSDADARDMALGMMADAGRYDFAKKAFPEHVLSNERMKAMVALKGAVREMTPRAVLSEYILAADPRKLSGVKGVDVERAVFGGAIPATRQEQVAKTAPVATPVAPVATPTAPVLNDSEPTSSRIARETTKENPLIAYSDGSDIKGTGLLGYGVWAKWRDVEYEISGTNLTKEGVALQEKYPDLKFSNPTMEMLALTSIVEQFKANPAHLLIRQDYKGAVNYDGLWQRAVQNAQRDPKPWKAKEPYIAYLRDRAVEAITSIEKGGGSVRIEWVRGHQTGGGEVAHGNDMADKAAKSREDINSFSTPASPEISASAHMDSYYDPKGDEYTDRDALVSELGRKNPYLPPGYTGKWADLKMAYQAYLDKGGVKSQGAEYEALIEFEKIAMAYYDAGVNGKPTASMAEETEEPTGRVAKSDRVLMDRNGKERTDATSGLLPTSTNGYRQSEMKIDASASDEFLAQANKLSEAARIAQEEITRGLLNNDDRVKAYRGRMRSPHNAYWYEGTAPRHAEALFRMDPQAALSWTGKFMATAFSDLIRQVEAIPGNASVIKRVTKRMEMLRSRLTENNGGLPDPRNVRGDAYGKLMNALGLLQAGINADTRELADMARTLGTPEGDAMAEQADDVYYGTAVALRVARSVLSRREFGEAGVAAPENIAPKSGAVLETPVASIYEVALADVDTGVPDPSDDFNMAWLMTDYWLAATVLPSFQGVPLRDLLMDKEPLAVVPRFIAMSNAMEAMFGTDSDTGSLRKGEKIPGGGHHLKDGGYVYDRERTKAETTRYGRRKAVKELTDIVSGNAFSDSEYAMARWFTQAIYVWAGDGGSNGRQILGNTVDLYNLNWKDNLKDTLPKFNLGDGDKAIADGLRKLSQERRDHANGKRPYDLDMLVHALDNNLPEPLRDRALAELVKALNSASIANSGAQGALKLLDQSGFIVPRRRDKVDADGNPTGQQEIYDARFSIPVSVTADVFYNSTAQHKLILNGRRAEDLDLVKNGQAIRDEYTLARKSFKSLSWFTDGDGRMFTGGAAAPLSRGSGFFQYHARKRLAEVTPDYRAKVNEAYASLKDALDACLDRKSMQQQKDEQFRAGVPVDQISVENDWLRVDQVAGNSRYARMFTLFRDLAEGFEGTESPITVAQMITSDKRYAHHGDGFGTGRLEMRSLAKAIYSMTVRKLHESAWDAGLARPLSAEEAGMEAFNAAMEDSAAERSADVGRVGATFSEIYDLTGALPANLTAGEALAKFATETATALRYRGALNQALLSTDEYGMPLIYLEPGDGADDTIPDTVWQAAARMWVRAAGRAGDSKVTYDESKSGKENAKLLYPIMVDGKVGSGATRAASGGLDRYVMTDVKVPAGISAVKRAAAMKNPRGDDTYAAADVFAGGEAAGQLEQLFAISGFTRTDMMLPQINRVLSWSKSLSVMNSFFFPIATAFESPIAAVGLWPTLFGLTSKGSDFFRKASEGGGALDKVLKAGGVDFDAPGMKDILKMIGSDDPALIEMKTHAILAGLSLADRSKNVSDHDRTALAKDVKDITAMVRKEWGGKSASAVKALMEGLLEHSSEFAFEYVINATKIAVFAQMNNRLRAKAIEAGRWWDPVLSMRKWAGYINAEVGGIDPATVAAMTPRMQNWLKGLMFSWEWTLGAWLAGGGGVLTQKIFGMTTNAQDRGFMFGRWARMYFTVMVGLPAALQIIATGIAKAAGDDEDDDKWFTWQNEKGRAVKDFDITPLLRHIGKSAPLYIPGLPSWGDIKTKLPSDVGGVLPVGAFIPGLTGDEGDMVSSRKRRYYMHFGKQGWEVAAWFENPMSSFLSKMSMPLQRGLEGVLGVTPSTGWETPFKELGFWERWLSLDGEKSATLNMMGAFLPFSYASMSRAPEAGALSMFGPVGKGMSKTRAEKEMQTLFENWADADSYAAIVKGNKGAWTDLKAMSVEWLDALRQNGYDPELSLKQAVAKARKPLYDAVHSALPRVDGGAADVAALERAARGLNRLDYIHRDLLKSLKSKDKLQNIKRSKELKDISNAAIRESFSDPYGRGEADARKAQSADLGGDVTAFLATDEIPQSVLGYKVVPMDELTAEDLDFFRKNNSAAGFFDNGGK